MRPTQHGRTLHGLWREAIQHRPTRLSRTQTGGLGDCVPGLRGLARGGPRAMADSRSGVPAPVPR
eukprot:5174398-Alexandrium_andersonii.AAC.1